VRRLVMALTAGALLALGATGAQASVSGARPNATPECGSYCFELSSLILGPRMVENAVVPGDTGSGGRIGVPATLSLATNIAPDEDFTETSIGPASDFCGVRGGFPKYSYICIHYAADPVFEADWAPSRMSLRKVSEALWAAGLTEPSSKRATANRQTEGKRDLIGRPRLKYTKLRVFQGLSISTVAISELR